MIVRDIIGATVAVARCGRAAIPLLQSVIKALRITLGILLIVGGLFGFLRILGFWKRRPLGVVLLGREVPAVALLIARLRRRFQRMRSLGHE